MIGQKRMHGYNLRKNMVYTHWPRCFPTLTGTNVNRGARFQARTISRVAVTKSHNRCAPCDINAYSSWLSDLVERYDGDGVNDILD